MHCASGTTAKNRSVALPPPDRGRHLTCAALLQLSAQIGTWPRSLCGCAADFHKSRVKPGPGTRVRKSTYLEHLVSLGVLKKTALPLCERLPCRTSTLQNSCSANVASVHCQLPALRKRSGSYLQGATSESPCIHACSSHFCIQPRIWRGLSEAAHQQPEFCHPDGVLQVAVIFRTFLWTCRGHECFSSKPCCTAKATHLLPSHLPASPAQHPKTLSTTRLSLANTKASLSSTASVALSCIASARLLARSLPSDIWA